jgi:hypothetical protein
MSVLRLAMILTIALGVLSIDVGESLRSGAVVGVSAHAKRHRHKHKKHARKRHHKHHAPATEM